MLVALVLQKVATLLDAKFLQVTVKFKKDGKRGKKEKGSTKQKEQNVRTFGIIKCSGCKLRVSAIGWQNCDLYTLYGLKMYRRKLNTKTAHRSPNHHVIAPSLGLDRAI